MPIMRKSVAYKSYEAMVADSDESSSANMTPKEKMKLRKEREIEKQMELMKQGANDAS